MAQERERSESMAKEGEPHQNPIPRACIWGEFCLAITQKSLRALQVRIHDLDRGLSLYTVAKKRKSPDEDSKQEVSNQGRNAILHLKPVHPLHLH